MCNGKSLLRFEDTRSLSISFLTDWMLKSAPLFTLKVWTRNKHCNAGLGRISSSFGVSDGKESACNAEDPGSIPGLGRSPGGGHGNPLQYSCLENLREQRSLAGYSPWTCRVGHNWATKLTHTWRDMESPFPPGLVPVSQAPSAKAGDEQALVCLRLSDLALKVLSQLVGHPMSQA